MVVCGAYWSVACMYGTQQASHTAPIGQAATSTTTGCCLGAPVCSTAPCCCQMYCTKLNKKRLKPVYNKLETLWSADEDLIGFVPWVAQ